MTEALVGGLAGIVTGAIASLIAPWVNWRIERVRQLHADRRARVDEWRQGLADAESNDRMEDRRFLREPWYLSLRPHLDVGAVGELETQRRFTATLGGAQRHRHASTLSDEIDRISQEWRVP